jgi:shikimate O-hydroxycinnamoyltransferase
MIQRDKDGAKDETKLVWDLADHLLHVRQQVLITAMHHFVVDGCSAFHFIQMWSCITRRDITAATMPQPVDRTPHAPSGTPTADCALLNHTHEYGGRTSRPAITDGNKAEYASAILRVTGTVSTFRALVAHI